jgi:hypothetical protein
MDGLEWRTCSPADTSSLAYTTPGMERTWLYGDGWVNMYDKGYRKAGWWKESQGRKRPALGW